MKFTIGFIAVRGSVVLVSLSGVALKGKLDDFS